MIHEYFAERKKSLPDDKELQGKFFDETLEVLARATQKSTSQVFNELIEELSEKYDKKISEIMRDLRQLREERYYDVQETEDWKEFYAIQRVYIKKEQEVFPE